MFRRHNKSVLSPSAYLRERKKLIFRLDSFEVEEKAPLFYTRKFRSEVMFDPNHKQYKNWNCSAGYLGLPSDFVPDKYKAQLSRGANAPLQPATPQTTQNNNNNSNNFFESTSSKKRKQEAVFSEEERKNYKNVPTYEQLHLGQTKRPYNVGARKCETHIQLTGRTDDGLSVAVHLAFWPSVVVQFPESWNELDFQTLHLRAQALVDILWHNSRINRSDPDEVHSYEQSDVMVWRLDKKYAMSGWKGKNKTPPRHVRTTNDAEREAMKPADAAICPKVITYTPMMDEGEEVTKRASFVMMRLYCKGKPIVRAVQSILSPNKKTGHDGSVTFENIDRLAGFEREPKNKNKFQFKVWEDDVAPEFELGMRQNMFPNNIVTIYPEDLIPCDVDVANTTDLEFKVTLQPPKQQLANEYTNEEWELTHLTSQKNPHHNPFHAAKDSTETFETCVMFTDIEAVPYNKELFPCLYDRRDCGICVCMVVHWVKSKKKQPVVITTMKTDFQPFFREGGEEEKEEKKEAVVEEEAEEERLSPMIFVVDSEHDMYQVWRDLVILFDPDILSGYNNENFDEPFMFTKMMMHGSRYDSSFFYLGRRFAKRTEMRDEKYSYNRTHNISGRDILDTLSHVMKAYKMEHYSLSHVGAQLSGGTHKIDLPHTTMFEYHASGDARKHFEILTYCVRDCDVPCDIWNKELLLEGVRQVSLAVGLTSGPLWSGGETQKVKGRMIQIAHEGQYVFTYFDNNVVYKDKYSGAVVLPAIRGFYTEVVTLDVASMYPSNIKQNNLCYSTLLDDNAPLPTGHAVLGIVLSDGREVRFVQASEHVTSVLPRTVQFFLTNRSVAKKLEANAPNARLRRVYNKRQLAHKLCGNSCYGFCGATVGRYGCRSVAEATTSFGRVVLYEAKTHVETTYAATVIYGDTDSIMIKFLEIAHSVEGMKLAFETANQIAAFINAKREHVKFEVEKLYIGYLLVQQKNYCGIKGLEKDNHYAKVWDDLHTQPSKIKLDQKGIISIKRDFCKYQKRIGIQLVSSLLFGLLDPAKTQQNIEDEVVGMLDRELNALVDNQYPIEDFIKTKKMKDASEYGAKTDLNTVEPHVVTRKMEARSAGSGYLPNQRVPFVLTKLAKLKANTRAAEAADDPAWVVKHNIPLAKKRYHDLTWTHVLTLLQAWRSTIELVLEKRLMNALSRIRTPGQKSFFECMAKQRNLQEQDLLWKNTKPPPPLPKQDEVHTETKGDMEEKEKTKPQKRRRSRPLAKGQMLLFDMSQKSNIEECVDEDGVKFKKLKSFACASSSSKPQTPKLAQKRSASPQQQQPKTKMLKTATKPKGFLKFFNH